MPLNSSHFILSLGAKPTFGYPRSIQTLSALAAALLLALWLSGATPAQAAPSVADIEKNIVLEQKKATERRGSLERLSKQERDVNAGLAAAESRILQLEAALDGHQDKLTNLAKDDTTARREYDTILEEQARTELAQLETIRLLWRVACKRQSVGGREMADWAQTDRDYAWSRELYAALEKYRGQLESQSRQIESVLGRREKLAGEMQKRLGSIENEKKELLQTRLDYSQRLTALRREKTATETELENVLKLVESLNFQLEQAGSKIETQKGRLPWPAKGIVRQHFAPAATPATRGIGIATASGQEVAAIAGGKVVHNDVLRGFGTVLILQHGEEYYSLYAFLGSSPLKVGEDVPARARIGTAGFYPVLDGPGLYFELRFKQKAINPEQWLAPL